MNLIDSTYFIGEINIAQADQIEVRDNLDIFITKYQKRFLTLLLGETLYVEFMAGLKLDPIPAKWEALRDKLVDAETKESPIANYVYYWYIRDVTVQTVGVGQVKSKAENATIVSPAGKMVRAWNEMVQWNWLSVQYLRDNLDLYPDWSETIYWSWYRSYCHYNRYDSIFENINSLNI